MAGGWWLVAGGWWLVAGGGFVSNVLAISPGPQTLVAGGWWLVVPHLIFVLVFSGPETGLVADFFEGAVSLSFVPTPRLISPSSVLCL